VAEEDRTAVRFAFDHGLEDELEFQVLDSSGQRRWLMTRGRPLPGDAQPVFMAGTLEDVTARRALQEQLRDAEAKYRALVEQLPAIVYIVKLDRQGRGRTTFISSQVERILGYTPGEWLADPHLWWKVVEPGHRERVRDEVRVKDEDVNSRQRLTQEYPVRARDGRVVWLRNESMTEWSVDGRTRYTDGVMVDVTATRADAERLRLLQEAFAALPLGITVSGPDGRILFVNETEAAAHGFAEPAELEGQPLGVLGEPPPAGASIEVRTRRRRDGSEFRAQVWSRTLRGDAGGVVATVIVTDAAERTDIE
jgi:PAS domain S-box-containing protein